MSLNELLKFVCITAILQAVVSTLFTEYQRDANLDGKICLLADTAFSVRVAGYGDSYVSCTARCTENARCASVFYDSVRFICTGCNNIYHENSTLDVSTGTVYFFVLNTRLYNESCVDRAVCIGKNQECFTDTCVCSPGYSYHPGNMTCVDQCDTYGTTFQVYANRRIQGNNAYQYNDGLSLNECLSACISDPLCVSIDHSVMYCNIQYVTVLTMTKNFSAIESFDHHTRDCA